MRRHLRNLAAGLLAGTIIVALQQAWEAHGRIQHADPQRAYCAALLDRTHQYGLDALYPHEFSNMLICAQDRIREQQERV